MKKYIFSLVLIVLVIFSISKFSNANAQNNLNNTDKNTTPTTSINNVYSDPKEEIQYKMYNSIDNFDKVKGNFTYHSDGMKGDYLVDYDIQAKNGISSKTKITFNNNTTESQYSQKSKSLIVIDNKNKTVTSARVPDSIQDPSEKTKNPKEKTHKNQKGEKVFDRRDDITNMGGIVQTSIFPQDIAASYLEDYNNWNIVSSDIKINNLDAVLIEGKLNDYFQAKHNATTFKLWVHKDTGILLQLEESDNQGNIKESIRTNDIKLNNNVKDKDTNNLNIPSDYKVDGVIPTN